MDDVVRSKAEWLAGSRRHPPNHWFRGQFWPDHAAGSKKRTISRKPCWGADCRSRSWIQSCGHGAGGLPRSRVARNAAAAVTGKIIMAWARDTGTSRTGGWLLDQPYLLLSLTSLFWAGNPQAHRSDDGARADRHLRLQHDGLLRPAIHDGDQRTAAAIHRAVMRGIVDLCAVRRSSHAAAGRW